ncbi:pseudouridine synthase [Kitasatospora paracochleata]|uniref:RNA pseudouridylate synthase n=1 Tax=Kitasatospora paracochleata TaxID=58354 RepID=A0ABT1J1A7_9ACTN|nr:pseudouridine synthase [Kitasatospora paracochleata]MCP2311225.1 tRNA pseudouridine32 synthase/23S rRNA pseudouridine746 synthase [Kitasatospora paracochleata]
MRRRSGVPASPLPQRDGIDPVHLRLPQEGEWPTVRAYLLERYGRAVGPERIAAMLARGEFVSVDGPIGPDAPFAPGAHLWFHRDETPYEEPVPFRIEVLHRDDRVVVVDKPHFLATTPRGRHITDTALARLRRDLDLPALSPAHRLDRLTAGVVLFVVDPRHRGAYQGLFERRLVGKEYEAIARYDAALELPALVRSRIVKERGVMAAREVPGEPNAESLVELVEHRDGLARYRLLPHTGRTHQLRVHMNALGVPILGDPLYPVVRPDSEPEDYDAPLQLLARALEFADPLSGERFRFTSRRTLSAWPGP